MRRRQRRRERDKKERETERWPHTWRKRLSHNIPTALTVLWLPPPRCACRTGREAHRFLGKALSPPASAPPPSLHPATNCPHGLVLCAHRGNSTSKSITSRQLLQSSKASRKDTEEPGHSSCLREED